MKNIKPYVIHSYIDITEDRYVLFTTYDKANLDDFEKARKQDKFYVIYLNEEVTIDEFFNKTKLPKSLYIFAWFMPELTYDQFKSWFIKQINVPIEELWNTITSFNCGRLNLIEGLFGQVEKE